MSLDRAFETFKALREELKPRLAEIETEQDARFQIINRLLTEVLDWPFDDIKTEPHSESGYTDYLLAAFEQRRFVIEAKRLGPLLIDSLTQGLRNYKVGGPALSSAAEGIQQAARYCLDHGVNYAAVTTGVTWIAFIPMPGGGMSYQDGVAIVFTDLDAIFENFAVFYDLFSKEGIVNKTYSLHFAKAGGLSIAAVEPLVTANRNEYIRLLHQSPIATDLEPIFREFFGRLSADSDRDMLIECFVETRESKFADASLEKIVRSVSNTISKLTTTPENQLAQEIQSAVDTGQGETVILVGNPGAGKTTYLERFYDSVLEPALRARCLVVRIDLSASTGDLSMLNHWLTSNLKISLERSLYKDGIPSFDQLQGLYWQQYERWMKGEFQPLYEADKTAFKVKFSEYLYSQIAIDPFSYVTRLLGDIVKNRKLLPCITFDNSDHFDLKFQEAVFQYSQAIRLASSFSFVVMPITDRSFWRLSKAGPFQTYPSKMFYLPVPPTKEVLEKRVHYLKRKLDDERNRQSYFFAKGIRLTIDNIKAFAACVEEVFIKEDFVSRRLSWLANNSLKRCLELAQKIILSPLFSVEDLVKAFIAYGSFSSFKINYRKFMQALLQGQCNAFQQDQNTFVLNVFAVSPYLPTTPLLLLGILKVLIDKGGEDQSVGNYVSIEQINQYFAAMGIPEPVIDQALSTLLGFRLVEPYDASDDTVSLSQRIAIAHSGRMHYEMALTDPVFVGDLAFATPVKSTRLVDSLRAIRAAGRMGVKEWQRVQSEFIKYCFDEDALHARIPQDSIYDGQRQLRFDLRGKWIENQEVTVDVEADKASRAGFSHRPATVKWYRVDRGYGFADAALPQDVFFHRNNLLDSEIETVKEGDVLICDIAPGPKGKLHVISIHSVQKSKSSSLAKGSQSVLGTVEFFNTHKGYGFIKSEGIAEDIYVSSKLLDRDGVRTLISGDSVKVSVEPGRFGRGLIATSIEILSAKENAFSS